MTRFLLFCLCAGLSWAAEAQLIVSSIEQRNVTTTGFDFAWKTNLTGQSALKYGSTTALEMGFLTGAMNTTNHQITLSGLDPASFYYVRPCLITATDTLLGTTAYYSTGSSSSGQIRIFFNKTIDASLSQNGAAPEIVNSGSAIESELLEYINNAQSTIDVCVYNNNRSGIVNALKAAKNRGVRVRYITDSNTGNTALTGLNFPVAYVNPNALMHNKFMVVDAESAADAVVWTGSMNWTDNNIFTDYNNVVVVHDQALARAYVKEFEEMWGSNTDTYNSTAARAGSAKTDNTPHRFYINGSWVECYFSPSDNATNAMKRTFQSAASTIHFLIYSFTRNDLGTALVNEHTAGTTVRGAIANEGDLGCELTTLQTAGADVVEDANLSGELHHKYAIIDVNYPNSDPTVITGSHNWSDGAEDVNDENTLIIHNAGIANMFVQEFGKRWCEIKGAGNCALTFPAPPVAVEVVQGVEDAALQVYPNPTSAWLNYALESPAASTVSLYLYAADGRLLQQQTDAPTLGQVSLQDYPAGLYLLRVQAGERIWLRKVIRY